MTIAYVNQGARSTATISPLNVAYPASVTSGNLLLLMVINKYSTGSGPNTPSGWSTFTNYQKAGGAGSAGNDSGSVLISIFVKQSDGTETGNVSITITGTLNTSMGQIVQYSKSTGTWGYVAANGAKDTAGISWQIVTNTGGIEVTANDMLLAFMGVNGDLTTAWANQSMSQSGVTFGSATERIDDRSSSGQDEGFMESEHPVTSGSGSGEVTFNMTGTGSGTNTPSGPGVILRLREVSGTTYEDSMSLARSATISDSAILTLDGLLSMNKIQAASESNIMDISTGITLASSQAVSDGGNLNLDGALSALKVLQINSAGGLSLQDSLSLNRNDALSQSYSLSIESLLTVATALSILQSSNLDANSLLSLPKSLGISLSTLADLLGFISLSYSKSISEDNIITLDGILSNLQKMLGISEIGGTVFEDAISLQKALFISILSGLAFNSALDIAKSLSISLSSDQLVSASITLTDFLGISEQATAELVGNLPVSLSLGIGVNSLATLLSQINLSNTRNISVLSGTNVDVSVLMSKILSIVSNGTIGIVVFPGMVIIIDREIVSTIAKTTAINESDLDESHSPYQVSVLDKPA